jgi:hypothetical protein
MPQCQFLFSAIFVFQKSYTGNIPGIGQNESRSSYLPKGKTDKGSIATTPTILPPPYVLKLGQFCFEVPPQDDVKPNFRTPPMEFHVRRGVAAKDI